MVISAAAAAISVLTGMAGGAILLAILSRGLIRQAQRDAVTTVEEARQEAAQITEEALGRAADELERRRQESHDELERERTTLAEYEADLKEREDLIESREAQTRTIEKRLDAEREALDRLEERCAAVSVEAHRRAARAADRLEERAGLPAAEAVQARVEERVGRHRLRAQMFVRAAEERATQNAITGARRVMAAAVDRYNGVGHLERIQNTIPITDPATLVALGNPDGPSSVAFLDSTGCELWLDEEAQTLTIRGDDPLGREISRRVLRQLANRASADPDVVRTIAGLVNDEVEREVHNAARKAARVLGIDTMHPDIMHLVGRLKFRLSFSQNQWKHAIEVGYLAGMIAEEMRIDAALARRGGLLHDIGKAMTHDHEGSHAVLGAQVARRCGENEVVANAIGSHHNDEPPAGPIALVVTAADAMSGARPGARRENAAAYMGRLHDINRIASAFPHVERVDIMHAGREVRVVVAADERGSVDERQHGPALKDADLFPLAQKIARSLEEEITYAGQIRVTVIRETRSIGVAS